MTGSVNETFSKGMRKISYRVSQDHTSSKCFLEHLTQTAVARARERERERGREGERD